MDSTLASTTSRYKNDFDELALLGKGGFGFVTKCRSRLSTDCVYAVKCIKLGSQCDSIEFMLREASNLARLHHKNVVRYFTAWLEKEVVADTLYVPSNREEDASARPCSSTYRPRNSGRESTNSFTSRIMRTQSPAEWPPESASDMLNGPTLRIDSFWQRQPAVTPLRQNVPSTSSESDGGVGFGNSDDPDLFEVSQIQIMQSRASSHTSDSPCISFEVSSHQYGPSSARVAIADCCAFSERTEKIPTPHQAQRLANSMQRSPTPLTSQTESRKVSTDPAYEGNKLYIVMEYVEGCTLRKLIVDRLCDDPNLAWDLFRQILEGLSYMHRNNLLHRDVKPENIFVRTTNDPTSADRGYQVKIGDLGLSKSLDCAAAMASKIDSLATRSTCSWLSTNVGTRFYIAPEVEAGARYDQAADMYAIGVVLFEMFHPPFETTMERFKELTHLQLTREVKGLSDENAAALVRKLLSETPANRPSASDLLELCVSRKVNDDLLPIINNVLQRPYSYEMLKILATLFGRKEEPVPAVIELESTTKAFVSRKFAEVMRLFNAILFQAPVLLPHNDRGFGWFERPVKYIDTSGSALQSPASCTALIRNTLLSVQNSTVVRRYTVATVQGLNGDVAVGRSTELHGLFDVVVNTQKLAFERGHKGGSVDEEHLLDRECLLEMEPLSAAILMLETTLTSLNGVRIVVFHSKLVPMLIHFLMDVTMESAYTVMRALEHDAREAAVLLKDVQSSEFERQYSFGELDVQIRRLEEIMNFEGTAGDLRAFVLKLVESVVPTADLDPNVNELNHIVSKLAVWQADKLSAEVRFRAHYSNPACDALKSRTGFGFAVEAAVSHAPSRLPTTAKAQVIAFGGTVVLNQLISNFVEFSFDALVALLDNSNQRQRRGRAQEHCQSAEFNTKLLWNDCISLRECLPEQCMQARPSLVIVTSSSDLLTDAYWLKYELSNFHLNAKVVQSAHESELSKARKSFYSNYGTALGLIYITVRNNSTIYRVCPASSNSAQHHTPHQAAHALPPTVNPLTLAPDKWFESKEMLLAAVTQTIIENS